MEFLKTTAGLELRQAGQSMRIGGYAAVFHRAGDPGTEFRLSDNVVERINPVAFDRSVEEGDVVALFNHNRDAVIGRQSAGTLRLSTDERGLRFEVDLPNNTAGNDLAESVRRGDVNGASFGFQIREEKLYRDGNENVRELTDVDLKEVSAVVWPAYAGTQVDMRSEDLAQVEKRLRSIRRARIDIAVRRCI